MIQALLGIQFIFLNSSKVCRWYLGDKATELVFTMKSTLQKWPEEQEWRGVARFPMLPFCVESHTLSSSSFFLGGGCSGETWRASIRHVEVSFPNINTRCLQQQQRQQQQQQEQQEQQ